MATVDSFNARRELSVGGHYYSISGLDENGIDTSHLPYSIRILLEGAIRGNDGFLVTDQDVRNIADWQPNGERGEIPFRPSRVILQDFTGVPAVVDLAALLEDDLPHTRHQHWSLERQQKIRVQVRIATQVRKATCSARSQRLV